MISQPRPEAVAETNRIVARLAMRGLLPAALPARRCVDKSFFRIVVDERGPKMGRTASERILAVACTMFGITLAEMRGKARWRLFVDARQYAAVRLRSELKLSLSTTGRLLNRHHTSIIDLLDRSNRTAATYRIKTVGRLFFKMRLDTAEIAERLSINEHEAWRFLATYKRSAR